jgi:hypothetical protein
MKGIIIISQTHFFQDAINRGVDERAADDKNHYRNES